MRTSSSTTAGAEHTQHLEQTVLAMRRVLERLKAENKSLKDAKGSMSKDAYDKMRSECGKIQNLYSDALDKISALKIELDIQTGQCVHCKNRVHKSDESTNSMVSTCVYKLDLTKPLIFRMLPRLTI